MKFYSLYGLTLQSDIPLHAPAAAAGSAPDLVINRRAPRSVPAEPAPGDLLCQVDFGKGGGAAHVRSAHGYTLRYYGTAEFEFDAALTRVSVHSDPAATADLTPEFLVASIPAFKLLLSGRMVLHASAVAREGKAIGILAQSGGGKSTLAAALCAQGHALVTDDVLVLDWRGDEPCVLPGPGELRLRPGAAVAGDGMRTRQTSDGRSAAQFETAGPTRLAALVTPVIKRDSTTSTLTRLPATDALATILGHLRVAGWKDTPALQKVFTEQVKVARQIAVYQLEMPWGAQAVADAARLLAAIG